MDDKEDEITGSREKTKLMQDLAKIYTHHNKYLVFMLLQSYDCFYKRHPLNGILQNSTFLVLFKSVSNFTSLKRWLNGYCVRLKGNQTLYDVYRDHMLADRYAYLIVDLSHSLKSPHVYSNILHSDKRPMLVFSVETDEIE